MEVIGAKLELKCLFAYLFASCYQRDAGALRLLALELVERTRFGTAPL